MTSPDDGRRLPGTTLLTIASWMFSEQFVSTVVHPTIADLQSEFVASGSNRVGRLRALVRGYSAFWTVMLHVPLTQWAAPERDADAAPGFAVRQFAGGVTALALLFCAGALFDVSAAILMAAGAVCAVAIHHWYERHPLSTAAPSDMPWRPPQINFSSMDVAGNVGGLIFVVGSLLVVVLGVPFLLTILMAVAAAGCLLAWRLAAWYRRHPNAGLPENLIVLR